VRASMAHAVQCVRCLPSARFILEMNCIPLSACTTASEVLAVLQERVCLDRNLCVRDISSDS
jgi:hypothetical protein